MFPLRHLLLRILTSIPTVIGALALMFIIVRVLPSDPISMLIDPMHRTPETVAAMSKAMGLDRPLYEQFFIYFLNIFKGNLGFAWSSRRLVAVELMERLPATLELLVVSLAVAVVIAVPLGVIQGWKRGKKVDGLISAVTLFGVVMPPFWVGLILIYLLYYLVPIFPSPMGRLSVGVNVNRITGLNLLDSLLTGNIVGFQDSLYHLVLPVIAMAFIELALLTRTQRTEIVEALESDYIKTARAKGLQERAVVFKHAFRNALLPTITQIGLIFGGLIGGDIMVEAIFSWPGIGNFAVQSIKYLDYAALQGFVIFTVITTVITNLIVDILYSFVDPRIRHGE